MSLFGSTAEYCYSLVFIFIYATTFEVLFFNTLVSSFFDSSSAEQSVIYNAAPYL